MPTNGMVEPILSFFLPRVKTLVMIDAPHVVSDTIDPIVEVYKNGMLQKRYTIHKAWYLPIYLWCLLPSKKTTRVSYKLRDFFSVMYVALRERKTYDLFIGLESVNSLAGILLQMVRVVNTVVYYVSDYAPVRFSNWILNTIYILLDRVCVRNADATWDVSPAMIKARHQAGLPVGRYRVIHVPNGLFPRQIAPLPIARRKKYSLVYMGILEPDMGPDLAIKAFSKVKEEYASATFSIVGGPEKDIAPYRRLVKRLGLRRFVKFYGFVPDHVKMADIVRHCAVGLAPYRAFPDSMRWFGDAGKIRQYTAAGLPVVTTHVPPLGHYIVEKGAGIMTNDTPKGFADGICEVLADKKLYSKLTKNAIAVSKHNTWERIYTKAVSDTKRMKEERLKHS